MVEKLSEYEAQIARMRKALTPAQRRILRQKRIYDFNTNRRALDALVRKGLVENVTEDHGDTVLVFAGIYKAFRAGRAVLEDGKHG